MKSRKKRKFVCIFSVLIILALFFVYYNRVVSPIIKTYSSAKINALTEKAVNMAVSNVINTTVNYDSLVNISYDENNNINYLSANQHIINTIAREVIKNAYSEMENISISGINLPVGTFTGLPFFIGKGHNVNLKIVPIGVANSKFESQFISVGINNTLHKIYLNIDVNVSMVLPVKTYTFNTKQTVLLCEGIIIGKVPNTYLNANSLQNMLDLVPQN